MPDGPFRLDLDDGDWVIKRDHPIVAERDGEVIARSAKLRGEAGSYIDSGETVELLNDAFRLGRAAADPSRFFHESLLQGDIHRVN